MSCGENIVEFGLLIVVQPKAMVDLLFKSLLHRLRMNLRLPDGVANQGSISHGANDHSCDKNQRQKQDRLKVLHGHISSVENSD